MRAIELLERLRRHDVRISFAGDRLRLNAPPGVLTPQLQAEIVEHKTVLRTLLETARDTDAIPIGRVDRTGPLPLSPTQQRMWVLRQLDPADATYHIVHADRLRGPVDAAALDRAWQAVVERQESLRTRIVESQGEPSLAIDDEAPPIRIEDLTAGTADAREAALRRLADEEAHRPFDFARGPLAELILARLAPEDHVLILRLHHIIADQWSLGVLRRDLAACYRQAVVGDVATLPPLVVQYADYATWMDARSGGPTRDAHLAYWREQLQGLEPLQLPSLNPRRPVPSPDGDRVTHALPSGLLERLSAVARRAGASLFMSLVAAYAVVLHRYTGRDDFSIGTPVAGRDRVELEGLIGAFINTLVLRLSVDQEQRFVDLLTAVRQTTLDAYAHQDIPFEQLVAALVPARQAGAPPLVQVMFNFLNTPATSLELPGITVESSTVERRASPFDLSVIVDAHEGSVTAEYRPDVIPAAGVSQLLGHYIRTLEALVDDPEQPIRLVSMLDADERDRIQAINASATATMHDRNRSVEQMVAEQARCTPQAIAVRCGEAAITYRELDARATALADHLRGLGVGPEVLVGVFLKRSEMVPVALLGVMKAGGAYLPLDPELPPSRLAWMLQSSGARLVLTEEAHASALAQFDVELLRLDQELAHAARAQAAGPVLVATGDHLAYVLYTSGSTGQPKGVQIPRRALANFVDAMRARPGIQPSDVLVAVTTLSFDIAALEIFLPLAVGATVVIAPREDVVDGQRLWSLLSRSGATMLQGTPTTWRLLIEAGWTDTPALKALVGGEALPPDLADELLVRATEVWNLYGPTETTIWSTVERITSDTRVIGIGTPIANTEVYVLDGSMQLAPVGVPGELYIGGEGVARGYLGRPDLTASRFVADPFSGRPGGRLYRTGDRARLRPEGRLEYLGRLDTQVKLRGFRIELGEIEAALSDHPGLAVAVAALRGEGDAASLVSYVIPRPGARIDEYELRAYLRDRLPIYMVPSTIVQIETLPLTANGKIDRQALPAPDEAASIDREESVEPRTATEQALARMWRELLEIERVGAGDDFFALGGHSLLAMRLVSRIHDVFGVALEPSALFTHSTLAALAEHVDTAHAPPSAKMRQRSTLVQLARGGSGAPFFWVHGVGGEVFSYVGLSQHLAEARPVYGFAADWSRLAGGGPLTVERMAERYVRELRAAHPHGPYHLGGFCSAALLAFEMARQLEAAGAEVGLVAAVDFQPGPPLAPLARAEALRAFASNLPRWWRQDARLRRPSELLGRLRSRFRRFVTRIGSRVRGVSGSTPTAVDLRDQLGMWRFPDHQLPMLEAHHQTLSRYRLKPSRAKVALFLPHAAPLFGPFLAQYDRTWYRLAIGGIEEHLMPGSHTTMMSEPFASLLAEQLEASMRHVEQERAEVEKARSRSRRRSR